MSQYQATLDRMIWEDIRSRLGELPDDCGCDWRLNADLVALVHGEDAVRRSAPANVTGDLHAAFALAQAALPRWEINLFWNPCNGYSAFVTDNDTDGCSGDQFHGGGETMPLALMMAVVKAKLGERDD